MTDRELREIVRPVPPSPYKPTERGCPRCNGQLGYGPIACPDGREGCLVLHYGFRCFGCGRDFQ